MIEIKSENGKELRARAIPGNTSRCGHCDMILLDGQTFFMLDEPYACIVHETCISMFSFDGKARCESDEKQIQRKEISTDEEVIGQYMAKNHWKVLKIPTVVREALVRFFFMAICLRQIYTPTKKREELIDKVFKALDLFKEK